MLRSWVIFTKTDPGGVELNAEKVDFLPSGVVVFSYKEEGVEQLTAYSADEWTSLESQ